MLIKVQDDHLTDKHLVECKRIHWQHANYLQCFAEVQQPEPSVTLILNHGDRVFIMNKDGQTVDSKRVVACSACGNLGRPGDESCEECK